VDPKQTDKAYSVFEIKAVDNEKRIIRGVASTPGTDRVGDIVDPEGAVFKLPIPLLWQHQHNSPIGFVTEAKVTKKGIEIVAELVSVASPSQLAARLEEAWQSIITGLVRGLSIGFSPMEYSYMDNGGVHYRKWGWNELSTVTIPCNADANITAIKSLSEQQAALGNKAVRVVTMSKSTGASVSKTLTTKPPEGRNMNIQEQLDGYKATLEQKSQALQAVMAKSATDGRTLDAAEAEEYDTLEQEIEATKTHIGRLEKMLTMNVAKAVPVDNSPNAKAVAANRSGALPAVAKAANKLAPGQEFAQYVMCLGAAKGDLHTAKSIAESRFPTSERIHNTLKAAVAAGTTTDATWALPLVEYNQFAGDFVDYLRPRTILGQFGQGGIPALRNVPFNIHIRGQTSGGAGYWVGQGAPKPLTKMDFNDVYLGYSKVANIAVLTEELVRFSNPSAELLVRDSLAAALIERLDTDFIDPSKAAVSNVSPASITNGVTPVVSSGNDATSVRADIRSVMSQFITANITPTTGVWIMSATTALALSLMYNALGQREFPDIEMTGGRFHGLPVIVSEYVPSDSNGSYVILANASDIWLADDGNVVVDVSREASLQMLDNPTNNSSTGTATSMVSMFQTNSVAIRAERWINWQRRRLAAVAVISGVNWGEESA
jgi:HK97 family phage major capsid protein/HK97 family phage prohead protease